MGQGFILGSGGLDGTLAVSGNRSSNRRHQSVERLHRGHVVLRYAPAQGLHGLVEAGDFLLSQAELADAKGVVSSLRLFHLTAVLLWGGLDLRRSGKHRNLGLHIVEGDISLDRRFQLFQLRKVRHSCLGVRA